MLHPQDFCERAQFRLATGGHLEAKLDGVIYRVVPFGDDAVQVVDKDNNPIATLGMRDGKFIPVGEG